MSEDEIETELSVPFAVGDEELTLRLIIKKSGEAEATVAKWKGSVIAGISLKP